MNATNRAHLAVCNALLTLRIGTPFLINMIRFVI